MAQHQSLNEGSTIGAAVATHIHDVEFEGHTGVGDFAGVLNADLPEAADDTQRLAVLDFLAAAFTYNLHVYSTLGEPHELLVANRHIALGVELVFANNNETGVVDKLLNVVALLFLQFTIGLVVVASCC